MAPMRAPASTARAIWAWSRSAKAVVCWAVTLWPGQRFTRVPNNAVGLPQWSARCSIRWVVVVLPLVPVTPIRRNRWLGCCQNSAASRPAQRATGSATTSTGSPSAGGRAAAAAGPITASTAPAFRASGQNWPPSTWVPGRPTNMVPAPIRRESQLTVVMSAFSSPGGTARPTWRSKGWRRWDITAGQTSPF